MTEAVEGNLDELCGSPGVQMHRRRAARAPHSTHQHRSATQEAAKSGEARREETPRRTQKPRRRGRGRGGAKKIRRAWSGEKGGVHPYGVGRGSITNGPIEASRPAERPKYIILPPEPKAWRRTEKHQAPSTKRAEPTEPASERRQRRRRRHAMGSCWLGCWCWDVGARIAWLCEMTRRSLGQDGQPQHPMWPSERMQ